MHLPLPPRWHLPLAILLAIVVLIPIADWYRRRYIRKMRTAWRALKRRVRARLRRTLHHLMRDPDDPTSV